MDSYRDIEGNYYYAPHGRHWGVWRVGKEVNRCRINQFISNFDTKVQAIVFCRKMNARNH